MQSRPTIVLRCEGSHAVGMGHVSRSLALAEAFQARGCRVRFAIAEDDLASRAVQREGYEVVSAPDADPNKIDWLEPLLADAEAVIVDLPEGLSRADAARLRRRALLVGIDDGSDARLESDLLFYPPVPQLDDVDWDEFSGIRHAGWQWLVLRSSFIGRNREVAPGQPQVLVAMGASDPAGMTLKTVQALRLLDDDFGTHVVLGPGFKYREALEKLLEGVSRPIQLHHDVRDMAALMARCTVAVSAFGVTAYELAAVGVPAVHLCLNRDHARSSSAFARDHMAVSVGRHDKVDPQRIALRLRRLLLDPQRLLVMSNTARGLVDGRGAERIALEVMQTIAVRT